MNLPEQNSVPILAKVSVIVPAHNSAISLESAVRSLLDQTYENIEIILVNDASSDGTQSVAETLQTNSANIKLVNLLENQGPHQARSEGFAHSSGEWITFLDADDTIRIDAIETLLTASINSNSEIAIAGMDHVSPDGKFLEHKIRFDDSSEFTEGVFDAFCSLEFGSGSLCNKLFHRNILKPEFELSHPWRQDTSEDTIVNLGCFWRAKKIKILTEQLYNYTVNPNSTTKTLSNPGAFTNLLLGFALASELHSSKGPDALSGIAELYSRQLDYDCYRVTSLNELADFDRPLKKAMESALAHNPMGLAKLICRKGAVSNTLGSRIKARCRNLLEAVKSGIRKLVP